MVVAFSGVSATGWLLFRRVVGAKEEVDGSCSVELQWWSDEVVAATKVAAAEWIGA